MAKNRAKRARERAGLSIGQAALMLNMTKDDLMRIEVSDAYFVDYGPAKLADVYGVNIEWLRGDKELRDYEAMKGVRGWDELTQHDRDVVAEFAASLPPPKRKQ